MSVGPRAKSYTFFGILSTVGLMAQNALWPRILGGVPRPYVQVMGLSNLEELQELADMMERDALRVQVGLVVGMELVQLVS